MSDRLEKRNVPPLSMRASLQPSSVNEDRRTVDVVWTTGARVLRGYYDRFWEELSLDPAHVRMDRLNGGAPFLSDHDGSRVRLPWVWWNPLASKKAGRCNDPVRQGRG
jgi:hypothetical protein